MSEEEKSFTAAWALAYFASSSDDGLEIVQGALNTAIMKLSGQFIVAPDGTVLQLGEEGMDCVDRLVGYLNDTFYEEEGLVLTREDFLKVFDCGEPTSITLLRMTLTLSIGAHYPFPYPPSGVPRRLQDALRTVRGAYDVLNGAISAWWDCVWAACSYLRSGYPWAPGVIVTAPHLPSRN